MPMLTQRRCRGVPVSYTHLDVYKRQLVLRAQLAMASAAHAFGKVPSHCVATQFRDAAALTAAALNARNALGYTRMWSIQLDQI